VVGVWGHFGLLFLSGMGLGRWRFVVR
jgi:hypothetical protein